MIVDTTVTFAVFDSRAPRHAEALDLARNHDGPIYIPQPVIAEASYFCRKLGVHMELALIQNLVEGIFIPVAVEEFQWQRIGELVANYHDLPLSSTDASIVAIAERLGVTKIGTFDQDFAVVQPLHCQRFELLP